MPTIGWVVETNEERITDAFPYHHVPPAPERIACPICHKQILGAGALRTHLGLEHPLRLPLVQVGNLAGASRVLVRSSSAIAEIAALNCTSLEISIDGGTFTRSEPSQLGERLATAGNAHHRIRLRNERALDAQEVLSEIEITVAIPSNETLAEVDRAFVRTLTAESLTVHDVDRFLQAVPPDAPSREYSGALADYVVGLLIKTQDRAAGARLPFDKFKDKFSSARHVLADFARPVARAVVAVIDFNLNQFSENAPAAMPQLRFAHRFFSALAPGAVPPPSDLPAGTQRMETICPIDPCTATVLRALEQFPKIDGMDDRTDRLPGFGVLPISEFDQAKVRALKAASATVVGQSVLARDHLRHLQHDFRFGPWAGRILAAENPT